MVTVIKRLFCFARCYWSSLVRRFRNRYRIVHMDTETGADLYRGSETGTELYTWILKLGLICKEVLKQVHNSTHGY
jgi:hypothetical protein